MKNYIEYPALSYSRIKSYSSFKKSSPQDKLGLTIGSIVDDLITNESEVGSKYLIERSFDITKQVLMYNKYILQNFYIPNGIVTEEDKEAAIKALNIKRKDSFLKKQNGEHLQYLMNRQDASQRGVRIVDSEEQEKAQTAKNNLLSCPVFNDLLYSADYAFGFKQILFQHEIYRTVNKIPFKIKPDFIIIDHVKKTIQFYDLKVINGHPINFHKNFTEYQYDLQSYLNNYCFQSADSEWLEDNLLQQFTEYTYVPNTVFVVVSYTDDYEVMYYSCWYDGIDKETKELLEKAIRIYTECTNQFVEPTLLNYSRKVKNNIFSIDKEGIY